MIDLINEILQTIRNNKTRTFLTGIAVTWGVFMLIVLLSLARGVTNSFDANLLSDSDSRIRVWGGQTSMPWNGNREGRQITITEKDLHSVPAYSPDIVEGTSSAIYGGSSMQTAKARINQNYSGVYPEVWDNFGNVTMLEGRFINNRDMTEKRKVMVIPQYYAQQLFPPEGRDAYGGKVSLNGLTFTVVGVYDSYWQREVFIPFTTARLMQSDQNNLGELTVNLKNVNTQEEAEEAEARVRQSLAKIHDFDPADERAVYISNSLTGFFMALKAVSILDISVWVLGILTLLTGIVGISNIMFVSVRERTHEIGIRRAIGAKPRKILTQILAEAIAITLLFGYLGIVIGTVLTQVIAHFIGNDGPFVNPTVSLAIAFEVTAVLVVAGALAGLFPALKALKVKPVEALRDE